MASSPSENGAFSQKMVSSATKNDSFQHEKNGGSTGFNTLLIVISMKKWWFNGD